ncbi:helix-turn-helix domain-containing protein [Acidovorax sp. PRC11]|uniref:helix-turn-helix domain-containing protein n=1 Tax=Acidovorax sp. PRC11 TaxID=2962592 RepID=UPI002881A9E5|nr:helix-turn-helix domain-containing protein [Acidovorax sp. PRC11]MDT0138077.1 helix-turn-helix domain-containing protein [Acidovorax sp. PRC11]
MANEIDPDRVGVGLRLKAAREAAGLSQHAVAERFSLNKATVSAWETGRGDPGVYRLRELAKLYKTSSESLLWDSAPSHEAMQIAVQFDALADRKKQTLRTLWIAFLADSKGDDEVESSMPATRALKEQNARATDIPAAVPRLVKASKRKNTEGAR